MAIHWPALSSSRIPLVYFNVWRTKKVFFCNVKYFMRRASAFVLQATFNTAFTSTETHFCPSSLAREGLERYYFTTARNIRGSARV